MSEETEVQETPGDSPGKLLKRRETVDQQIRKKVVKKQQQIKCQKIILTGEVI